MKPSDTHDADYLDNRALLLLLVAVTVAMGWILLPFYGTIMWGAIIALLFAPLYRRLLPRMKRRRTPAALVTLLVVLVIVVLPLTLITASLAREAGLLYQRLQSGEIRPAIYFQQVFDAMPGWVNALLDRAGLDDFAALQQRLSAALAQGSQFIATQALNIGQNAFDFIAKLFIALYLAFFLIRDGEGLARTLRRAIWCCSWRMRCFTSGLPSLLLCSSFTSCLLMRWLRMNRKYWTGTSIRANTTNTATRAISASNIMPLPCSMASASGMRCSSR